VTTGPERRDAKDKSGFAFTYGLVEARVRVPKGRGLWPAGWMLPTTLKSRVAIDIIEVDGSDTSTI
jgi:beta-glucanase (GH16 family)